MSNELLSSVGERICERRKALNYTQEQLAERMDVSVQMISNLERGNKAIRIENLVKISAILQVSTDYILTGKYTDKDGCELLEKIGRLSTRDHEIISKLIDAFLSETDT